MAVVESQVRRKGYHSDTVNSTIKFLSLDPNPLLLLDDAVYKLAALCCHRCFGATLKRDHSRCWEAGVHLLNMQDPGH